MQITIGSTVLCASQTRNSTGQPVGPSNFRSSDAPGIVKYDYVGADRTRPEHIKCDAGTVTFDVNRTFATVEDAVAYACYLFFLSKTEENMGKLWFAFILAYVLASSDKLAIVWQMLAANAGTH